MASHHTHTYTHTHKHTHIGVTIHEPATMRIRCTFTSDSAVHAVSGSANGIKF